MITGREDDTGASVTGTREPTGINASCGWPSLVVILSFCWVMVFDRFTILRAGIWGGGCRGRSADELGVDSRRELSATNGIGGLVEGV